MVHRVLRLLWNWMKSAFSCLSLSCTFYIMRCSMRNEWLRALHCFDYFTIFHSNGLWHFTCRTSCQLALSFDNWKMSALKPGAALIGYFKNAYTTDTEVVFFNRHSIRKLNIFSTSKLTASQWILDIFIFLIFQVMSTHYPLIKRLIYFDFFSNWIEIHWKIIINFINEFISSHRFWINVC